MLVKFVKFVKNEKVEGYISSIMNTDDFKGIDQHTITRRQIKVLLGALSYTYDDA